MYQYQKPQPPIDIEAAKLQLQQEIKSGYQAIYDSLLSYINKFLLSYKDPIEKSIFLQLFGNWYADPLNYFKYSEVKEFTNNDSDAKVISILYRQLNIFNHIANGRPLEKLHTNDIEFIQAIPNLKKPEYQVLFANINCQTTPVSPGEHSEAHQEPQPNIQSYITTWVLSQKTLFLKYAQHLTAPTHADKNKHRAQKIIDSDYDLNTAKDWLSYVHPEFSITLLLNVTKTINIFEKLNINTPLANFTADELNYLQKIPVLAKHYDQDIKAILNTEITSPEKSPKCN